MLKFFVVFFIFAIAGVSCNVSNICYTSGTFDMLHVGHINLLRNAKGICDKLIVGVHPDDVVEKSKNKKPIISLTERMEMVRAVRYVDMVVEEPKYNFDREDYRRFKINTLVIGDDYLGKYDKIEKEVAKDGVKIVYIPYTKSQSSSKIREKLKEEPSKETEKN